MTTPTTARANSRREFLRLGGVSLLNAGLLNVVAGRAMSAEVNPRIKSCLLLFQVGGVSQTDTFDMKPEADAHIRGEFKPISTNVVEMHACEHMPLMAKQMDKVCVVRSMHHRMLCHNPAIYSSLSGREVGESLAVSVKTAARRDDFPHLGSVVARYREHPVDLPPSVALPYHVRNGPTSSPGQNGGLLGREFDPFVIARDPNDSDFSVDELTIPPEMVDGRLTGRRRLLAELNAADESLQKESSVRALREYYRQAITLLSTDRTKQAFDLSEESSKLRDRYGRNVVGQSTLLGRRLIEAGVPFVTVYSPVANVDEPSWDTHKNNFPRLKNELLPPADQALSAVLEDMHTRGLLDETLVIWAGEFGRTPEIGVNRSNNTNNVSGRDHWPHCYTILMAGGGIPGGTYFGASDKSGWYPKERPIHIGDFAATIYDAFGIDPKQFMYDSLNRPHVLAEGSPVRELFG